MATSNVTPFPAYDLSSSVIEDRYPPTQCGKTQAMVFHAWQSGPPGRMTGYAPKASGPDLNPPARHNKFGVSKYPGRQTSQKPR